MNIETTVSRTSDTVMYRKDYTSTRNGSPDGQLTRERPTKVHCFRKQASSSFEDVKHLEFATSPLFQMAD